MASKHNLKNKNTIYDKMTTDELWRILLDDAERTEDNQIDAEQLLQIMEVICGRESAGGDVKKSIEIFKKYYLSDNVPPPAPVRKPTRWKRGLVAAAAALAVLIGGLTIPDASGKSALQHIAQWSDDFFWFEDSQQSENPDGTFPADAGNRVVWKELRDLLTEHGITSVPLPNWMPEGYELRELKATGEKDYLDLYSSYTSGDNLISFDVRVHHPEAAGDYSKNPGDVHIYQYNGIDFYIIGNMRWLTAVWIQNGYECSFSGPFTMTEIINAIHTMTIG